MTLHTTDISKYYESLDEAREDGYVVVKCWSVLQFYALRGKTTLINRENMYPLVFVEYVYFSPLENRYYLKAFSNYTLDDMFIKPTTDNEAINVLKQRIEAHGVWLLLKDKAFKDIGAMLERIWNATRSDKGKLRYIDFIALAELSLNREYFAEYNKSQVGYSSKLKGYDDKITEFWKSVVSNSK